jgi:hypothetical protein
VYFYGPLVSELVKEHGDEGLRLIEEDLQLDDSAPVIETLEDQPNDEPKRHSRQRTVTALVKKLVLIEGQHNPLEIAKTVVTALRKKEIKTPKNLFIVYCIIKDRLMKDYFKKLEPGLRNYREVIKKFGREYKFSASQIAKIDSELKIPVLTQEVCKDGRSREARQKSKARQTVEVRKIDTKFGKKGSKKRKKLPADKCGECFHDRKVHKLSPKGAWARCQDTSVHEILRTAKGEGPCFCKRFKEKER